MNAKRGPRPSEQVDLESDSSEKQASVATKTPEMPAKEPEKPKGRPSFGDLYRYGRATYLGLLNPDKLKSLTSYAEKQQDPWDFMDSQAVAVESSVEAGGSVPELPALEFVGKPKHRAVCPVVNSHTDVRIWRVRPNNKRDCICHVCGREWVQ